MTAGSDIRGNDIRPDVTPDVEWIDLRSAAARCRVKYRELLEFVDDGDLPAFRVDGGEWRFRAGDVQAFADARRGVVPVRGRPPAVRLPWEPVAELARRWEWSNVELARQLDVDPAQVYRWARYGVTDDQADKIATTLGRHPIEVWGREWEHC